MSRMVDVICENTDNIDAINSAQSLVREHLVGVSYVIPMKKFTCESGQATEKETTILLLKSKDIIFRNKLLPRLKELSCRSSIVFPIVNFVTDYRTWVEDEVHE